MCSSVPLSLQLFFKQLPVTDNHHCKAYGKPTVLIQTNITAATELNSGTAA